MCETRAPVDAWGESAQQWVRAVVSVLHRALVACTLPASVSSSSLQGSGPSRQWGLCPWSQPPNGLSMQSPTPFTGQALAHAGPKHSPEPLTPPRALVGFTTDRLLKKRSACGRPRIKGWRVQSRAAVPLITNVYFTEESGWGQRESTFKYSGNNYSTPNFYKSMVQEALVRVNMGKLLFAARCWNSRDEAE